MHLNSNSQHEVGILLELARKKSWVWGLVGNGLFACGFTLPEMPMCVNSKLFQTVLLKGNHLHLIFSKRIEVNRETLTLSHSSQW